MADEFRFTCSEGHTWVSSNKIRSFCPECGKSTRRVSSPPGGKPPSSTNPGDPPQPKNLSIKHVKVKKPTPPKTTKPPDPHKEEPKLPTRRAPQKPPQKPPQKTPSKGGPLTQKKAPTTRKGPIVGKKIPRTTKQSSKSAAEDTMFSRMRKMAFGR